MSTKLWPISWPTVAIKQEKGLGTQLQRIQSPINLPGNKNRSGIGFKASMEEKIRQGLSLNEEHDKENIGGRIPHLKEIFPMPTKTIHGRNIPHEEQPTCPIDH